VIDRLKREILLTLHAEFLRWAQYVMPPGDEQIEFARAIYPYCRWLVERTRDEVKAAELAKEGR
jgi:hypothetical protein